MTTKKETKLKNEPVAEEITYTKDQVIKSKKYAERRDLVGALLADEEEYTLNQVDGMIKEFMKRKVK